MLPSCNLLSCPKTSPYCPLWCAAWYGLKELGALRRGMTVLVHSAAGGVGLQVGVVGGAD